ncbi:MAG: hydrogenase formation protein HypD [Syntrophorhabdales bacterium]|jgi:hydrogenase expression/formation protein HypD
MQKSEAFRDPAVVEKLKNKIWAVSTKPIKIMEFCGTHTHAIHRFGIRQLVPPTIGLFSGPGCPVCVTDNTDIDHAIALSKIPGVIIATFGDLLKVPGSRESLLASKAEGAHVAMVYSPLDALTLAADNPSCQVVFLGIGFETTAPAVAASIVEAEGMGLDNYSVLSMHKLTPPAMRAILDSREIDLDAILCPGHVSIVTGWKAWQFLPELYHIPAAVAGFEPVDILLAISELVRQCEEGRPRVANTYPRGVTPEGNGRARETMEQVFERGPARWRGLGTIPASGMVIREEYARHDARRLFTVEVPESALPDGCHCGEVIRGVMTPDGCPLFRCICTPSHPIGPCMVSSEGSCAAYYLYG